MDREEMANRALDRIGSDQRKTAREAMDAFWENPLPLGEMVDSRMSSLKTPGRPEFKPAPVKKCYCDEGFKYIYDKVYEVLGKPYSVELKDVKYPCDCDLGRELAQNWKQSHCPECEYGVISEVRQGYASSTITHHSFCRKCETGLAIHEQITAVETVEKAKLIKEYYGKSGLAPLQLKQTFDNYICKVGGPGEKAIVLLKTAAKEKKSLLLIGNTGVGKSHLAAAYLNFSISLGNFGLFISLTELMAALRKTINAKEDGLSWDALLEKYINTPLLVLDDIGQEKPSEKVNEVLFTLLNTRINWERPTIVTTNYGKDVLLETGYSPAIVSRLGSFEIVRLSGEDYRVKTGAI